MAPTVAKNVYGVVMTSSPGLISIARRARIRASEPDAQLGQADHHRGIFPDGIEHDRAGEFRHHLAENVNAFGLEGAKVSKSESGHGPLRSNWETNCR
jgi:hypothetical protein